ncbi:MAG: HAMP domain-containing sensor histidine kinase [Pseudomonadota bacterium]
MKRPGAIWRTTAVRLAAVYTALFCLGLGLGLGALYLGTIGVIERQRAATLEAEVRALSERFREGGTARLVRAIDARTAPDARGDAVYLLVTPQGRRISGNLTAWPVEAATEGPISFGVSKRDGEQITQREVRALAFNLPRGYRLLVGRDNEELEEFRNRFLSVSLWIALGAVILGLVSGLLLGRRVLGRVARAAEAGEGISAGQFERRVPVSGRDDEFDRLAVSVNGMLDRIEGLMQGMRIATDSISHDVRRPLTRARAELELALRRDPGDAQAAMLRSLSEIDRATGLLGHLLDIARAEAGVQGDSWSTLDLASIADDAVELYQPIAEERGVTLVAETRSARMRGEAQLLAQALTNLLDNALKYAPAADGRVAVDVRPGVDGQVSVSVRDNGPGIPEKQRDAVTERFVRLDAARGGEGSGLGLSLVRAVARLHGGTLAFGDNMPGVVARMTLPTGLPATGSHAK